jgi:hypothetical protein
VEANIGRRKVTFLDENFSYFCVTFINVISELVVHHAMHASPNFICPHCLAGFTKSHFLEKHVRTRHQSFQFNCENCKRQFPDKTALVIHTKMYTGKAFTAEFFAPINCHLFHYQMQAGVNAWSVTPNTPVLMRSKTTMRLHTVYVALATTKLRRTANAIAESCVKPCRTCIHT